jgi:acetoin utilization deacetylase AcuC-like enzyme
VKVVYAADHRLHAPVHELTRREPIPYPESPQRAETILKALQEVGYTDILPPDDLSLDHLLTIHDAAYLEYLQNAYLAWVEAGNPPEGVVSVTFALRDRARPPRSPAEAAGYYCFDTTPIVRHTFSAAMAAASCALTGADLLLSGERSVYALCRPPGHHAGRDTCGGYCYLNNAAVAASHLSRHGSVAILDIDFHHGNGTQDIFYTSDQILFVSIHADPDRCYPFFWGRADETGEGAGCGFNHNFPLPPCVDDEQYLETLERALEKVAEFDPAYLVISAGVDTLEGDTWSDFLLSVEGFERIGERLAAFPRPSLLVQEGGYNLNLIGKAVVSLLHPFGR